MDSRITIAIGIRSMRRCYKVSIPRLSSNTDGRLKKAEESIAAFAFNSFKYKYGGQSFAITKKKRHPEDAEYRLGQWYLR